MSRATADDALTAVWDGEYDGVIVQETLPDIGGVELLRLLRTGSQNRRAAADARHGTERQRITRR